jgi:hypothetical protein
MDRARAETVSKVKSKVGDAPENSQKPAPGNQPDGGSTYRDTDQCADVGEGFNKPMHSLAGGIWLRNRGLAPGIRLYDAVGISHGSDPVQPKEPEVIIQAGEGGKTKEKQ